MTWLLLALGIAALVVLIGIALLIHGLLTAPVRDDWH